jgi:hypothetical protein
MLNQMSNILVNCRGTVICVDRSLLALIGYFQGMIDLEVTAPVPIPLCMNPARFQEILDAVKHGSTLYDPAMLPLCRYISPGVRLAPKIEDLALGDFIDLLEYQLTWPRIAIDTLRDFTTDQCTPFTKIAFRCLVGLSQNPIKSFAYVMVNHVDQHYHEKDNKFKRLGQVLTPEQRKLKQALDSIDKHTPISDAETRELAAAGLDANSMAGLFSSSALREWCSRLHPCEAGPAATLAVREFIAEVRAHQDYPRLVHTRVQDLAKFT